LLLLEGFFAQRVTVLFVKLRLETDTAEMAVYNLEKTAFMLCDIQERFRPVIHEFAHLVTVAETMVS
jgi:hypothetical protein